MSLRFVHPPRTGGSSIRRSWNLDPAEYDGHAFPGEKIPGEWRYGTVRNPWDRAVSLYRFPPTAPAPEVTFRTFVESRMASHAGRWSLPVDHMAAPQARWLKDADFLVRFENRDEDLAELAECLGRPLPDLHIGPSPNRLPYRWYYTHETRDLIAEMYAEDIELFGYTF
ncbi:MAG: sulfotransferase family 2 domain-containing protein [Nitrospiraceae bacterium]